MTDTDRRAPEAIPHTGERPCVSPKNLRPPSFFVTQDLLVLTVALVLFASGALAHAHLAAPRMTTFDHQGLSFQHPQGWLPTPGDPDAVPVSLSYQSPWDARSRIEVRIQNKPVYGGALQLVVDLARGNRYGEFYKRAKAEPMVLTDDSWLRTAFRYAHKASAEDAPQVLFAIEFALVKYDRLYVVTVHGGEDTVEALEEQILGSLAVP